MEKKTRDKSDRVPTNSSYPRDNGKRTMKEEKLTESKLLFRDDAQMVLPSGSELAGWYQEGWVCLYYYPFGIDMRFLFTKLFSDVLASLHVSPGQLMPSAWRTLACLDTIEEKHKLKIDAYVVKYSYSIKKFSNCRYSFVNKNKDGPLILNNDTDNDRG